MKKWGEQDVAPQDMPMAAQSLAPEWLATSEAKEFM
jgi:hypothetical protein